MVSFWRNGLYYSVRIHTKTETLYVSIEDFKTRFHTYTFNYQNQIKSNLVTIRRLNHKLNFIFLRVDSLPFKNNVK